MKITGNFYLFLSIFIYVGTTEGFLFNRYFYKRAITFTENEDCQNGLSPKYAVIIHGWSQSCNIDWVKNLTQNLEKYRGGCIICMDYGIFASILDYFLMVRHIKEIASILTEKFRQMEYRGYDPNEAYVFGFSLGGRIAVEAGRAYGNQKIAEIDICDMTDIGFSRHRANPKDAARNVQCIHTSIDKGTRDRNCHQNWNMGYCGISQVGAKAPPFGSHGLCPYFYNSAFENNFYAEYWPKQCPIGKVDREFWPLNFKMGYMDRRKFQFRGNFYASTTRQYPFTNGKLQRIRLHDTHNIIFFT